MGQYAGCEADVGLRLSMKKKQTDRLFAHEEKDKNDWMKSVKHFEVKGVQVGRLQIDMR